MYGEIGYDITDTLFIKELDQYKGQEVKIRANSPGGEVFQGFAMYNAIKQHGQCDIQIDGLAASMMTVIMLAGRKISASKNAMIMIHNPSSGGGGDSKKLKKDAELLDKIKNLIISGYSERTGISPDELSTMLDAETWLTAQEALEKGFIDEITDEVLQSTAPTNLKNRKPKAVYMSYKKEAPKPQALTTILGLKDNADNDTILKAISSLKNKCVSLETENTLVRSPQAVELAYDKLESVIYGHRMALRAMAGNKSAHAYTPTQDTTNTPVLITTGDNNGDGFKRLVPEDILKLKKRYDLLEVPFENRYLVLDPNHVEDLILYDLKAFKDITDFKDGQPNRFAGFNILQYTRTAKFDFTTRQKLPFGAVADANTVFSSFSFSSEEVMKAMGNMKMYEKIDDPEQRATIVGFDMRFIALPIRNKAIGAIMASKI